MDEKQAREDLKAIREIMARTRKSGGREGGWFMVVAGVAWLIGYTGTQFLPQDLVGWLWIGVNVTMMITMILLGVKFSRRSPGKNYVWRFILLFWLSLFVFAVLLAWLLGVNTGDQITILILLTIALGYVLIGLFYHWFIAGVGIALAILVVTAYFLLPVYFSLAMGILGGGLLIGSGVWFVRHG